MLLLVIAPATALGTPAAQKAGNFMVSVAGTAVGSVPHQIDSEVDPTSWRTNKRSYWFHC